MRKVARYLMWRFLHKIYQINCQLSPEVAVARIKALLSNERVRYHSESLTIVSTETPFALLSGNPIFYSHQNWVGINPFAFISGLKVSFTSEDGAHTMITVQVNRHRAIMFFVLLVGCGVEMAIVMPPPAGVLVLAGVVCLGWLAIVSFLAGYLIKLDIDGALKLSTVRRTS